MSSVPEKRAAPPLRRPTDDAGVRAPAPSLRLATLPPELYPSLVDTIRVAWRNRHAGTFSREVAERGRETGARL